MKSFIQNNTATVVILIATIVLAGIATFTAIRLYQLRVQPVSPVSPQNSNAQTLPTDLTAQVPACRLTFTLTLGSPTATSSASPSGSVRPTATSTARATATATSSATPKASSTPAGLGGLTSTPTASSSATPKASTTPRPTSSAIALASSTPIAQLPNAGSTLPTLIGIFAAILLLITAFAISI